MGDWFFLVFECDLIGIVCCLYISCGVFFDMVVDGLVCFFGIVILGVIQVDDRKFDGDEFYCIIIGYNDFYWNIGVFNNLFVYRYFFVVESCLILSFYL